MPENLRVVSYLVGASLATAALIYIIGPDHVLPSTSPIGLSNRANDCFINSVLQALAGIPEMREYLIRETHRRAIDPGVYEGGVGVGEPQAAVNGGTGGAVPAWKLHGLRQGIVTRGLKQMLDALNEKPRLRKSIAPTAFIDVLQEAFRQLISRQQQDAHEFLQIVAQRLEEEYATGRAARLRHAGEAEKEAEGGGEDGRLWLDGAEGLPRVSLSGANPPPPPDVDEGDLGFPMHGRIESQIECRTCGYQTKPRQEDFYILTLHVPHLASVTLDECFRQQFRAEEIEDYRCDKCRLVHMHARLEREANAASPPSAVRDELDQLDRAITLDPESLPDGTPLTRGLDRDMPRRTVSRTSRISRHPRVLVVHLSRSIFSGGSQKNAAKVAFPERLLLGSLTEPVAYRLLSVVMHRGSHDSGHYDSFRRQAVAPEPFPNQSTFRPSGVYSRAGSRAPSRNPSRPSSSGKDGASLGAAQTPRISTDAAGLLSPRISTDASGLLSPPSEPRLSSSSAASDDTTVAAATAARTSISSSIAAAFRTKPAMPSPSPPPQASSSSSSTPPPSSSTSLKKKRKPKKRDLDRWWRISDEKVKEARTADVLEMQREVYMLFYELERASAEGGPRGRTP
jgi:ubiquitin carboxyl-terminal hydrolase 16